MSRVVPPSGSSPDVVGTSEPALVQTFDELLRSFPAGEDGRTVFERLVGLATRTVPACDEASVSVLDGCSRVTTPCATSDIVAELDNEQYRSGRGPCLSAVVDDKRAVYSPDLAADERWPEFGRMAAAQGFQSVLSRRFSDGGPVGGINLYARRANAFGDDDQNAATLLIVFASAVTALASERSETSHLRQALQSRDVIGQAKGILMERHRLTADEAFDVLRRASQHKNRKLRDVAEDIATTGEAPPTLQ